MNKALVFWRRLAGVMSFGCASAYCVCVVALGDAALHGTWDEICEWAYLACSALGATHYLSEAAEPE